MTEPAPTPAFRRFPWIQLAFCIACLTMTGYTWMRFSYAWDVTPYDLHESNPPLATGGWEDFYVRLHGVAAVGFGHGNGVMHVGVDLPYLVNGRQRTVSVERPVAMADPNVHKRVGALVADVQGEESPLWAGKASAGRVVPSQSMPTVDTRSHRFTGASVAGRARVAVELIVEEGFAAACGYQQRDCAKPNEVGMPTHRSLRWGCRPRWHSPWADSCQS